MNLTLTAVAMSLALGAGYALADTTHGMLVKMTIRLPVNMIDGARHTLVDMTQGKAGFF